jgi:hypothetical protein
MNKKQRKEARQRRLQEQRKRNSTWRLLLPDGTYAPLDETDKRHSQYRELEDQEAIPIEKRKYYGRAKS